MLVWKGMFSIKKLFRAIGFVFIILTIVITSIVISSGEQSLNIRNWIVESSILENGDIKIVEDITFNFNGKYNGVFREIILEGTSGIEEIKVMENRNNKFLEYERVDNAEKGNSDVFLIDRNNKDVTLQIFSPSRNEEKLFRVTYTVKNVARKYNDIGEIYYKFLGEQNNTPIDFFSVNIILPQKDVDDAVRVFAHGPLNGEIHKINDNTINLQVKNVPERTFIESRILFPKQFIPASKNIIDKNGYSNIMNEEANLQRKMQKDESKKEARKSFFSNVAIIFSVFEIAIFIFFLTKYRRPRDIHAETEYLKIPDDNTPAVVNYITGTGITSNTIIATILDLYRRGYFKIDTREGSENEGETVEDFIITKIKEEEDHLLDHEKYFIGWLIDTMGNGISVATEDIENYSKKESLMFTEHYNKWIYLIKEDADNKGYFDKSTKKRGLLLVIFFPIGLVLSIVSLINENISGLFLIFTSILMLFQGIILLSRRSDYGHYQYKKWTEFKKHMKRAKKYDSKYDFRKYPKDISLIYGLTFGIDNSTLNRLNIETTHKDDVFPYRSGWLYWYFIFSGNKSNAFSNSINNSFSGVTSSIGKGGGFTGGGGGGAGGGGAGGF